MSRFFLSKNEIDFENRIIPITGADAHHIGFALRMAVGEKLTVCDMQKTEYLCTIAEMHPDRVLLHIDDVKENDTELPVAAHLYQSVPKGDKMDYIVQKAVELGCASVTPVMSSRCIVRLDAKNAASKQARWQKIAAEAAKQCGRGYIPEVRSPITFAGAAKEASQMDHSIFCYEGDGMTSLKTLLLQVEENLRYAETPPSVAFFIGPEGGYDTAEVHMAEKAGMMMANLGKRILRCETASGFVLSAMIYAFEL